jgi:hypothetical protein
MAYGRFLWDDDMGEWYEKLKGIWEWSRFYPPPARYFFALTAFFVLMSAVVFLVFRRGAAQAKAASDFADSIPISIDADVAIPTLKVPEEIGIPDDRALRYRVIADGGIVITPMLPYLDKWNAGEEVEALHLEATRFRWRFPCLDVRFTNDTDKQLILNKIVVEVSESIPDDDPIILVANDFSSQMSFKLLTPIREELSDCTIEYNLADTSPSVTTRPYAFSVTLPKLSGHDDVRVDDALAGGGAIPSALRLDPVGAYQLYMTGAMVPAMGPFKKGSVLIRGQIKVKRGAALLGPYKFVAEVALVPPGPQALLQSSASYDALLREYGKQYTVDIRTTNTIPPNGAERILIRVASPRSSYHEFRLRFQFHDGRERVSGPIKLRMLRPE